MLHQPLTSYRSKLITCTTSVKRIFAPQKMFSDFCHVRYYEKKWATRFSSLQSLLFVQKFVFSTTRWLLKKWSYNFHSNCQINFLTLQKSSQKFVTLDNTRIIRSKSSLHWNFYRFLSKILYFLQLFRSWSNGLISCTKIVRRRCAPPQKAPWGFPYSILR